MRERILLVDDDALAQDLLKSVLQTRGYVVDTAEDGFAAVRMLRNERYDLALIDYHMPDLDGFASARLLRDASGADDGPKLVAVTADNSGLAVRPGADTVFDAILPKVVAPQPLISSIEQLLKNPKRDHAIEAAAASWRERGLSGRPKVVSFPVPAREQALALDICFDRATLATADMIVLLDETASETISAWRARATDFLLPVVDLSGALATSCDATFSINDPLSWNATAEVIIKFATRRAHLARESQRATDLDTRLMAYLYVADRALSPIGDPASKLFIRYPGFFPADELSAVTDRLMSRGLLRRTFVDRFHSCGSCHAHRLNVREECLYCRSPHLSEVSLLHHFSCAALKPEDAFRSGKNLICPKCRQHLRHYGSDYDKPGTTLQCGSCGASNSDPVVGFSCQDCGAHTDGDAASTTDVHAFDLTDEAIARLTAQGSIEFRGGELPPSLEWELKSLSRDFREPATAIARISYLKREDVVKTRGTAAFLKLRELFIENLRNVVADLGSVVATEEDDYLLLKETDPQELSRLAPLLFEQCEALLAESIGPDFTLIDASGRLAS